VTATNLDVQHQTKFEHNKGGLPGCIAAAAGLSATTAAAPTNPDYGKEFQTTEMCWTRVVWARVLWPEREA
jgi:hypothetical protein